MSGGHVAKESFGAYGARRSVNWTGIIFKVWNRLFGAPVFGIPRGLLLTLRQIGAQA